jgi:hypothetical protein
MSGETIEFSAIPNSGRRLKVSEDGGGYRITLDLDEGQFAAWAKLVKVSGTPVRFSGEPA